MVRGNSKGLTHQTEILVLISRKGNMKQVKVISGKYEGLIFEGARIYYDHLHTGSSLDLFSIETPQGNLAIASDLVDVEHYEKQLLNNETIRLGAKVGDRVKIICSGSGYYKKGWNEEVPHMITGISPSGHVKFDNGMANIFRPDVVLV